MMRTTYYERLKALARDVRAESRITTPRVMKSDLRRIYRNQGIRIDLWPYRCRRLRGAYINDDLGPTVMLVKGIPVEPTIFTMAHELKHHLVDQGLVVPPCDSAALLSEEQESLSEPIEIGAEVFAAELIFPEGDFIEEMSKLGVGPREFTPAALVRLKERTRTTMSYAALAKRAEFLRYVPRNSLAKVKWKKLEEEILGEPVYKRVNRARRRQVIGG